MHDIWSILADEIRKYEAEIAGLKVTPAISAEEIRHHSGASFDFRRPHSLPDLTRHVVEMLKQWSIPSLANAEMKLCRRAWKITYIDKCFLPLAPKLR
jgi:hypothetical protein